MIHPYARAALGHPCYELMCLGTDGCVMANHHFYPFAVEVYLGHWSLDIGQAKS